MRELRALGSVLGAAALPLLLGCFLLGEPTGATSTPVPVATVLPVAPPPGTFVPGSIATPWPTFTVAPTFTPFPTPTSIVLSAGTVGKPAVLTSGSPSSAEPTSVSPVRGTPFVDVQATAVASVRRGGGATEAAPLFFVTFHSRPSGDDDRSSPEGRGMVTPCISVLTLQCLMRHS